MRIILLILSILIPISTYAHIDIHRSISKENIHFVYSTGWEEFEVNQKVDIFVELAAKLVKAKNYTDPIYIELKHNYTKHSYSSVVFYGKFSYWKARKKRTKNGLKIIIWDRDLDIKKMLSLVYSALTNVNYIKEHQEQLLIPQNRIVNGSEQFDTLTSISSDQIQKYFDVTDPTIDQLLNEKTYRNLEKADNNIKVDYYFQNNQFHFYDVSHEWEGEKYTPSKNYGEDILVVDNILEIVGHLRGHFVFINDSVFYYLTKWRKASGPFKMDSVRAGRKPIYDLHYDQSSIGKYTFYIDDYYHYGRKAVFFPDSNLLISNFAKAERNFLQSFFNKPVEDTDKNKKDTTSIILLIILMFSVLLNIGLVWRQQKNNNENSG